MTRGILCDHLRAAKEGRSVLVLCRLLLQDAAVADGDGRFGASALRALCLHSLDNVRAILHLAKDDMCSIKIGALHCKDPSYISRVQVTSSFALTGGNKELRAVSIGTSISHR